MTKKRSTAFFAAYNGVIFNDVDPLKGKTILHEFAHAFHFNFDSTHDGVTFHTPIYDDETGAYIIKFGDKEYNFTEIVESARDNFINGNYSNITNYLLDKFLKERHDLMSKSLRLDGKNFESATQEQYEIYKKLMEENNLSEILKNLGLDELEPYVTNEELYDAAKIEVIKKYHGETFNKEGDVYQLAGCFCDIIDSLFGGDHTYILLGSHGKGYYSGRDLRNETNSRGVAHQYNEVVAQVITLMQLSPQMMPYLYDIFGEDYMNMFMEEVNTIFAR